MCRVTCTAIAPGQTNRCQFPVTVIGSCSNCVEILCPSNLTVACTGPAGTAVNYSVFVTNRCSTNLFFNCTPPSGATFQIESTDSFEAPD
jgi:hypothetical protein